MPGAGAAVVWKVEGGIMALVGIEVGTKLGAFAGSVVESADGWKLRS